MIKFEDIKNNAQINTYIKKADETLEAICFTEHSFAHATKVSSDAAYILETLGYDERSINLAKIAGYMHDIGNVINRNNHSQSGAILAFRLLDHMNMDPDDIADIISAIGNHDEGNGNPVNAIAAALIIADKSDVRQSRVREKVEYTDIHDRVNYSVKKRELKINNDHTIIKLKLEIDTKVSSVMDYFEIFLTRMLMCKSAAAKLNIKFKLIINEQTLI